MKNIKLFLIAIFFITGLRTYAQNYVNINSRTESGYYIRTIDNRDVQVIEGSPYFNKEWEKGSVTFKNGKTEKYEKLKFNLYTNTLEFNFNDQIKYLSDNYRVESFTIGNSNFIGIYHRTNSFYKEIFYKRNIGLLKKYTCQVIKGKQYVTVGEQTNDKFKITENLYLLKGFNTLEKIKLNQKKILKLLADKKEDIELFVVENNLSYKNEEDVIKIIDYYTNL